MASYNEDAVDGLVSAATGAARILQEMEIAEEDQAQAHAYRLISTSLWDAVENVLGHIPMEQ